MSLIDDIVIFRGVIKMKKRKPVILKANNLIEKRNLLNEMKTNHMTLQEVRFFTIYLSKINARDTSSRFVRFPLEDFQNIMGLGRLTIPSLQATTDRLLSKVVNIRTERGGYDGFQLFSKCKVDKNENEEWFIEINAHDDALPLMFDFKKEYFTYELWNALKLSSPNQIRMYELLKQYESIGERIISLKDLKDFIGIKEDQYPRFGDFKVRVLNKSQKALKENTDILFEYELIKKGAKVIAIRFLISKNDDYTDQICLEEFIEMQKQDNGEKILNEEVSIFTNEASDKFDMLVETFNISKEKAELWYDYSIQVLGYEANEIDVAEYIRKKMLLYKSAKSNGQANSEKWLECAIRDNYK